MFVTFRIERAISRCTKQCGHKLARSSLRQNNSSIAMCISNSVRSPPRVAVIGCGPGGMFFLHALAVRRRLLQQQGQSTFSLPVVTCYESADSFGGVWRSERCESTSTNMYEALWTNGPHTAMEFADHTYQAHFGHPLPVYLPRKMVLDYITKRVTKDQPDLFDGVKFNTKVTSVRYDSQQAQFVVDSVDANDVSTTCLFDKCIWAAGSNGRPKIPEGISMALTGFKGKVMHSSQTDSQFDNDVRGKSILIVGDSHSAEDLTLQAIKLGVEGVTILSRSGSGCAYWTAAWPGDKVDVEYGFMPSGVTENGCGVILTKSEYDFDTDSYVHDEDERKVLDEVDTVIHCTGYTNNMEMLDPSLSPYGEGDYQDSLFSVDDLPKDWKMDPNPLSEDFGEVPVGTIFTYYLTQKNLYRGMLIKNPNMMFMSDRTSFPLFDLDVQAWLLLAHITGDLALPSVDQMNEFNREQFTREMNDVYFRYYFERNYRKRWWNVGSDHWTYDTNDKRNRLITESNVKLQYFILAREMLDAKYPANIGTYEELNEKGLALMNHDISSGGERYLSNSLDADWKTFRDCIDPSSYSSIFTGTKAVPLRCHWLDIEGDSYSPE